MLRSRPKMNIRRRGSALTLLLVAAVVVAVVGAIAAFMLLGRSEKKGTQVLAEKVKQVDFQLDVIAAGEVESSEAIEVRCDVKGRNSGGTSILEVAAEGTQVQQGDILVKLDSSALETERLTEQIMYNNKEAAMIQAKNLWEAAILAKKEYLEGTFVTDEQLILSELFVAEENLRRAQQYAKHSERMAAKGYVTALQLESDRFAVQKAGKDLQAAKTKLNVLQQYTKEKMLRQLESDIKSAEAAFNAEKSSFELEVTRLAEIDEQIKACTIYAPVAGQVVHANERNRRGDNNFVVEPGALVRERQVIVRLPQSNHMQIRAKISESKVALVREGMQATVTIDAYDDKRLVGQVTKVNEYPEPANWFSSSVKEYVTLIRIDNPPANLKSGLTAKVRVHAQLERNAVQVPVQAIHRHQGRYYCMVQDGPRWVASPVTLGASNEKSVVIADGLAAGQLVALDPTRLLGEVELPDVPLPDGETQLAEAPAAAPAAAPINPAVANSAAPASGAAARHSPEHRASGGPAESTPRDSAQIVSMIFSRGDKNGDGTLGPDEMSDRFEGNFADVDTNSDGQIDRAEMTAAMAKRQQASAPSAAIASPPGAGE